MLATGTRYCHNYKDPILPHEELPDPSKKKERKRTKEQMIASALQGEHSMDIKEEDKSSAKKRIFKRKLKKKESETLRSENPESAGVVSGLDLKPISMCENFEESEEVQKKEDEKENLTFNGATNEKSESNELKKPDTPIEVEDCKQINDDLSSISGFPNLGDESEDEQS